MNSSDKRIYNFKSLYEIVNELKSIIFSVYPKTLINDDKKREYFNNLLINYSKKLNINNDIENENNIVSIVNNKIYSCLNLISIADKSAHVLDEDINNFSKSFVEMYELYSSNHVDEISFMKDFNEVCPEIENINKEFIKFINKIFEKDNRYITDEEFHKIYDDLEENKDINYINGYLIEELSIDPKNEENALELYQLLKDNKRKILEAYLYKKYNIAKSMLNLQNDMFAIKNYYLEMIADLLKEGQANFEYEIIKNDNLKEGFKYSLSLDDKDNSYHKEIPLSNIMKERLIKEYNFKIENNQEYKEDTSKEDKPITLEQTSLLRNYLDKYDIHKYDDILKFADEIINNKNYSSTVTQNISNNYYLNVYQSLDPKEQNLFILDSLYNPHEEYDTFDKEIINKLKQLNETERIHNDIIAKILISKNQIKESFSNEDNISFEEYIDNYIDKHNNMENNYGKRI